MTCEDIWEGARHALRGGFHWFEFVVECGLSPHTYQVEEALANYMGLQVNDPEHNPTLDGRPTYRFGTASLLGEVRRLTERATTAVAEQCFRERVRFEFATRWDWDSHAMELVTEAVNGRLGTWRVVGSDTSNFVEVVPHELAGPGV